jgi:hypothetical protein
MSVLLAVLMQSVPIVTPLVGPPQIQWLATPRGDAPMPAPDPAVEALRIDLFHDVPQSGDPACAPEGAATAANNGALPTYLTTVRLVPRLTLAGFGRGGCAFNGVAGGGLVYTMPVTQDISLRMSAGMVYGPHSGPNGTAVRSQRLRTDLVFKRPDGSAFTVGISTRGITFGGVL